MTSDTGRARDLFFSGLSCLDNNDSQKAEGFFLATLKLTPRSVPTLSNLAIAQYKQNKITEAAATAGKVIEIAPDNVDAYALLSSCQIEMNDYAGALVSCEKILAIDPINAEVLVSYGHALNQIGKYKEALGYLDRAISIRPQFAEAFLNRGNALRNLKRYDEALASQDRALALRPDLAQAWLSRGNILAASHWRDEALAAYDKALAFDSGLAEALLGRANIFVEVKQYDHALAVYDQALALNSNLAEAWHAEGNIFNARAQYDKAIVAYDKALALNSSLNYAEGDRLLAKLHLNDWHNLEADTAHLLSAIRQGKNAANPFHLLSIAASPADQLQCARMFVTDQPSLPPLWRGERYAHDRIRIAYLSADFHDHPVANLMAGLFEHHDRSRFEMFAVSLSPNRSEMRRRIQSAFEHFIDAERDSDDNIADLIRRHEIDIVVDLMGFTLDNRINVLARRPAPIQVNYLGNPGTSGAGFIDYIIADRTIVPKTHERYYSEKIVCMPDTFQVNDRNSPILDKPMTRTDAQLPRDGLVFCCFNASHKFTPAVFDRWIQILREVDGSVLWLYAANPTMISNLRREAVTRGVDAARLVFAPRVPLAEHQSRLRLADLFLDTSPFSAGATASGALWAGLPILTFMGETFAGRMSASLLKAVGLAELITTSLEAYQATAIALASHPEKIADLKRRLADNRLTMPLFDTARFTRHIEAAYTIMWEHQQRGEPPRAFTVAPID